MDQSAAPRFFLGANSRTGFFSLYDSFTDPAAGDFLWVIKGGPGCGKSSFMRRVGAAAEAAGLRTEYILCSGDPDSLDGVRFPDRHVAYVDGTAPHVIEPKYPGASSLYLDLGAYLDAGALEARFSAIAALNGRYQALYGAAYAQLAAAAALLPRNHPAADGGAAVRTLARRIEGIAARELRPRKKPAKVTHRFLSARSCQGHVVLTDTLQALCPRLFILDNALGLGHHALAQLADAAAARGWDAVVCHDPLEPEKLEALLLPEGGLGFLAVDDAALPLPQAERHLRLDALASRFLSPEDRPLLRQRRKESRALLCAAEETLARAKALHDELEAVYHPHVDFDGVGALAEDHIRWLLERT